MDGDKIFDLMNDQNLKGYLWLIAKTFTKNEELQRDLIQEAWIRISFCRADYTTEYYIAQGYKAIDAAYHREWREWNKGVENKSRKTKREYNQKYYLKRKLRKSSCFSVNIV